MADESHDLDKLEKLAALELSAEEKAALSERLARVLGYVEQLQQVDTEGVEPTSHAIDPGNVLREDEPGDCLPAERALAPAPARRDGHFEVPAVMGGGEELGE